MPYYVRKTHTWKDNWNDIVRYVIFNDSELMSLMSIEKEISIMQFIEKYFVETKSGSQVLMTEKVRINYYDQQGSDTRNKNVRGKSKHFDIYVREDILHTASSDRLANRYDLISQRLKYLILNHCLQHGLRFSFFDGYNLWTKTQGYRRYHIVFDYRITT